MGVSRNPARPVSGSPAYSPDNLPAYRGGSSAAPSGPVTLIYDSFTEATVTSIVDHTPDTVVSPAATPWAQNGTHFRVDSSGVLELASVSTNNRQCWIETGIADGIYSVGTLQNYGILIFRRVDATNYWFVFNANGSIQLWEINSVSGNVQRASYATTANNREIQVITNGSSISVYVEGTLRISHTSSVHATATAAGFRAETSLGSTGNAVADNFTVIDSTDAGDLP